MDGWIVVINRCGYNYDEFNKMGINLDRNKIRDENGKLVW